MKIDLTQGPEGVLRQLWEDLRPMETVRRLARAAPRRDLEEMCDFPAGSVFEMEQTDCGRPMFTVVIWGYQEDRVREIANLVHSWDKGG